MNWSLQINGKQYNNESILEIGDSDISDFLQEWGNNEPAITVQTSGSTGTPKLISLLKSDMIASAKLTGQHFNLKAGQSALLCLPIKYIAGKMMLVRAIVLQFNLISVTPSSNPIIDLKQTIDFAAMTPMQVKTILDQSPEKLDLIKQLIIGSALVDAILESKLQGIKTLCYSTYGMTETITHIAVKRLNGGKKSDSFEALPNVTFQLNENDCLVISTPHLSASINTTNDIAKLINTKSFMWLGRADNVINSGGVKIQPEALEKKLSNLLKNTRFFFSSLPDEQLGERVVLVIESESEIANIEPNISSLLDKFEIPKTIYFTANFIETETGKVNRKETLKNILSV